MRLRKGLVAAGVAAALMLTMAVIPWADAAPHVFVRPAFGFYYGPGSGWYQPWAHYRYFPAPTTGDVKINTPIKGASIYVDGGFTGVTGKLKKFPLRPGNHLVEVRDRAGRDIYENTIHVIAGQTVDIHC